MLHISSLLEAFQKSQIEGLGLTEIEGGGGTAAFAWKTEVIRGFYDVPRVLFAGARSFQALSAILD